MSPDPGPAVERIRRVPDVFRVFAEPAPRAARFYRIPPELLDEALDLGLPHSRSGGRVLLDRTDLDNLLLGLALPSPQRTGLELMGAALGVGQDAAVVYRTVDLLARCPEPGHPGDCGFELCAGIGASREATGTSSSAPQHCRVSLALPGGSARYLDFTAEQWQLLGAVAALHFHHLPAELADDLRFLEETGLADCRTASRYLVSHGPEVGLTVRSAFGLVVSTPFSTPHTWIELEVRGRWVTADPFFLAALARWGVVDPERWPLNRSPTGAYWKVASWAEPFVTHRGLGVPTSLITR